MNNRVKIIRTSTVPGSLDTFCRGLLSELQQECGYEVVAVSSPGDRLDTLAAREGVRTVSVPMERHISPLKDLKSLWRLVRVFRRERPTMVHSMTPKAGLLSMMAAWICRVPVRLHTFTGLVFPTATGLTQKILVFTEGEGVRNDLTSYRITAKPLKVLGHGNVRGIDLERFDPSLPEVIDSAAKIRKEGVFTFIFIGRLVRDKGINELVLAFTELNREIPDTRLILVGEQEPELDPLSPETLENISGCASIEAVGRQNDVRPWLAASDALAFPSYREGFPNVVIEAGAMGLPSIVTDINGSREIVSHGVNGVIIPTRDRDALLTAMRNMIGQREDTAKMATAARPMVAGRFEQSFVRKCLKDYYKEILNK